MSACIIPAGPEFQDPPSIPDSAPYIVSATPEIGSITTGTNFAIVISDPNVQDDLNVRWLLDWPETVPGNHTFVKDDLFSHDESGKRLMAISTATIGCNLLRPAALPLHRLFVVVADRDFDENDITAVVIGGNKTSATWVWNVTCQQ